VRVAFDRIERFLGKVSRDERAKGEIAIAFTALAADASTRAHYLAITRDTQDPALRVRMIALARDVDWLTAEEQTAELARTIHDVLAGNAMGFGEVDLVCTLNRDRALDASINRLQVAQPGPAQSAALACLGSQEAHARMLKALASPQESEVQIAQAYLRHRPITDDNELREVVREIARANSPAAQARALETVARLHVSDRETQDELARMFATSTSLPVQRAIAEVFIRAGVGASTNPDLAATLRKHRVKAPSDDLIDVLIRRLGA
jgi:hypothetical protein